MPAPEKTRDESDSLAIGAVPPRTYKPMCAQAFVPWTFKALAWQGWWRVDQISRAVAHSGRLLFAKDSILGR